MWNWINRKPASYCEQVGDALERAVNSAQRREVAAIGTLLAQLPDRMRQHIAACENCRALADELLELRGMFEGFENKVQPGPYFLARVMATIAARERQLEQVSQTWAAVPRLASRFAVLASLGLLIAASWVYEMPKNASTTTTASMTSSSSLPEGLVDSGNLQDDLLVSGAAH